jgi:hypothetical protein
MTTALYRLSSNEVLKISVKNQSFADRDTTYWGMLTDPTLPDGSEVRDPNGDFRVLGYAKIVDGTTIRNATQAEIDTFEGFEIDDENQQDADAAKEFLASHPRFRKILVAMADIIKNEINIVRGWTVDFKAEVASANNLGDLQDRVALLPDLDDRTMAQFKNAMLNRVSKDD